MRNQMLNAENIFEENKFRFSEKALKQITAVKTGNLIHQYNEYTGEWHKVEGKPTYGTIFERKPSVQDLFIDTLGAVLNIQPTYIRKIAQVRYFGARIKSSSNKEVALSKLAEEINFFAENDFIMGNLAELMELKLYMSSEDREPNTVFVSYLIFTDAGINYLNNNKSNFEIKEGETPKALED